MISHSTDIKAALRSRQRGFLLNPYRFGAGASDPYYSSVTALLHMDGTNGSTTFTDQKGNTWTANGNAQISTAQSKWGGASGLFDGTDDYVQAPDHSNFEFGGGDFTIEAWVRPSGYAKNEAGTFVSSIVSKDVSGGRQWFVTIGGTASSWTDINLVCFTNNSTYQSVTGSVTLNNNQWYHLAAVRSGSTAYVFADGMQVGSTTSWVTTIQDAATAVRIGAQNFDATYRRELNGYVDDLRITKGIARYTANFTPPTSAFPDS